MPDDLLDPRSAAYQRAQRAVDDAERAVMDPLRRQIDGPGQPGIGAVLKRALQATAEHSISIVPAPKMDTPNLVASVCSCGTYRSSSGTEQSARKAGQQHVAAKTKGESSDGRVVHAQPQ